MPNRERGCIPAAHLCGRQQFAVDVTYHTHQVTIHNSPDTCKEVVFSIIRCDVACQSHWLRDRRRLNTITFRNKQCLANSGAADGNENCRHSEKQHRDSYRNAKGGLQHAARQHFLPVYFRHYILTFAHRISSQLSSSVGKVSVPSSERSYGTEYSSFSQRPRSIFRQRSLQNGNASVAVTPNCWLQIGQVAFCIYDSRSIALIGIAQRRTNLR